MGTLANAIAMEGLNGTAAAVRESLAEMVPMPQRTSLQSIRAVKLALNDDLDLVRIVAGTLKAVADVDPAVDMFRISLCGEGISFADAQTQEMIGDLATAGKWPDSVRDALLAMGRPKQFRWEKLDLVGLPTEEEVKAAIAENTNRQAVASLMNEVIAPAVARGDTIEQIKAAVAAHEV
jgi:hypothetical protein